MLKTPTAELLPTTQWLPLALHPRRLGSCLIPPRGVEEFLSPPNTRWNPRAAISVCKQTDAQAPQAVSGTLKAALFSLEVKFGPEQKDHDKKVSLSASLSLYPILPTITGGSMVLVICSAFPSGQNFLQVLFSFLLVAFSFLHFCWPQ